jgi:DUF1680 family protein
VKPPRKTSRREFLSTAATATGAALLPKPAGASPDQTPPIFMAPAKTPHAEPEKQFGKVHPFQLSQVRLRKGPFLDALDIDRRYLHLLPNDRLLHTFRLTAGIPSNAEPLGGWEAPDTEMRGPFVGHYLSACALMYSSAGDTELRDKANSLVSELARCQKALRSGYLCAFPEEHFDRLREGRRVICPFYKYHKVMAGLIDMYVHCGNEQALEVADGMAWWVQHYLESTSDEEMQRILQKEFGGMAEALWNLYALTGRPVHKQLATRFEKAAFLDPLAEFRDELKGLHGNTHLPQVIGAARRYELTRENRYRDIASYFFEEVTARRCYATGGTTNDEFWRTEPGQLASQLGQRTQECCTSYNMLKLARHIFSWTADPRVMDYYERTLFNSRLGTQNPEDGGMCYFLPLGSGYWKYFNTPFNTFWCCTGTGIEEFAKTADSIYFHDDASLYVNLFIASELNWPEKGLRVEQVTNFPEEQGTTLVIHAKKPTELALNLRIPYWAGQDGNVKLNGEQVAAFSMPSSYLTLPRTWQDGDRIELRLPMNLHAEPMPDDPSLQAILYGPLVLGGKLGTANLTKSMFYSESPTAPPGDGLAAPALTVGPDVLGSTPNRPTMTSGPAGGPPQTALNGSKRRLDDLGSPPLAFQTKNNSQKIIFIPLYKLFGERYAIYWKVNSESA